MECNSYDIKVMREKDENSKRSELQIYLIPETNMIKRTRKTRRQAESEERTMDEETTEKWKEL